MSSSSGGKSRVETKMAEISAFLEYREPCFILTQSRCVLKPIGSATQLIRMLSKVFISVADLKGNAFHLQPNPLPFSVPLALQDL
jgi:hypothetical protein